MIHTMKTADVIRRLRSEGWELHHVKGSHYQFKSIFRQAGWKWGA